MFLLLMVLVHLSQSQQPPPVCRDEYSVCNALVHASDRRVDLGLYCAGECAVCRAAVNPVDMLMSIKPRTTTPVPGVTPTTTPGVLAEPETNLKLSDNRSFVWWHYSEPGMRVQFVRCAPFPSISIMCPSKSSDVIAAVFSAPRTGHWLPEHRTSACTCPSKEYFLRGWRLSASQVEWLYEFTCYLPACQVRNNRAFGISEVTDQVCASEYKSSSGDPEFRFHCLCPRESICNVRPPDINEEDKTKMRDEEKQRLLFVTDPASNGRRRRFRYCEYWEKIR